MAVLFVQTPNIVNAVERATKSARRPNKQALNRNSLVWRLNA